MKSEDIEHTDNILVNVQESFKLLNGQKISDLSILEQIRYSNLEVKNDVRDVYICFYNDGLIGLFMKNFCCVGNSLNYYGNIYLGIDSNCIGIDAELFDAKTEEYTTIYQPTDSMGLYRGNIYTSNCHISSAIKFDDVRYIMKDDGVMTSFTYDEASTEEMLAVLDYAGRNYASLMKNDVKEKIRQK